jgi:hypothetical protein
LAAPKPGLHAAFLPLSLKPAGVRLMMLLLVVVLLMLQVST